MAAARMPPPPSAGVMMSPPYGGGNAIMGGGGGGAMAGNGPPGTLAPGTQIMVGPIVVTVQKYLSQGGFAYVYLVTTDKPVPMPLSATSAPGATKSTSRGETLHVLKRMAVPDKESLASVRNEVEIHKQLRNHANIVHFIEASATALRGGGYEIFILMEYCAGGGIIDLMNARLRTRLKEAEVLKIFGDVAAGLSVMHNLSPPLMHRDLKVENILLSPPPKSNPSIGPTYKLCDFGSSKALISRKPAQTLDEVKLVEADLNKHTTLQYRAPEMVDVYQRRVIDEKADIWAMGVLLYKLCYYTTPFEENGGGPLAILNARYRFPPMPVYSQRLKDLIASMLQEQSSARPSIDEILLRVHRMLGTQPPASVMNKISAVMKNKSASPTSPSERHQEFRPSSMHSSGSRTDDLIEVGQTEAERKRADEEALRKQSEAITPMRRGRPTKGSVSNTSSTAAAAAKFEQAAAATMIPGSSSMSKSFSLSSRNQPSSIGLASPSNAAFSPEKGSPLGFTDSFAPSTLQKNSSNKDLMNDPSRPSSALDHSPSLPGFDASSNINSTRASPLPPPVMSDKDDDTSNRFPSVEELDKRYPTDTIKQAPTDLKKSSSSSRLVRSPPSASPSPHSSHPSIPGLSNRAPVSAMADKFGAMASKRSSVPVQSKPLPPVGAKPSGLSSIGNRWPHQQAQQSGEETFRRNSTITSPSSLSTSERVPPSLPSRKHDWLQRNGTAHAGIHDVKETHSGSTTASGIEKKDTLPKKDNSDDSSGEDDLPPEDLDAPSLSKVSNITSTFAQAKERASARQIETGTSYKSSQYSDSVPGKVKTPDWIKEAKMQDMPPSKSTESLSESKIKDETQSPSKDPQFDDLLDDAEAFQQKAKPPAWDEDDEEMHFLPQPSIHSTPSGRPISRIIPSEISNTGRLIDFDEEIQAPKPTPVKQYVDAATSPRQESPSEDDLQGLRQSPIISRRPTIGEGSEDVGNVIKRFEDIRIGSDPQQNPTFKKPVPPVKPGNIQLRRQESMNGGTTLFPSNLTGGEKEMEESSRRPPAVASKPKGLSTSSTLPKKAASMPPSAVPPPTNRLSKPASSSLKPWEKEAMEKERVEKFGSLRSRSPVKQVESLTEEEEVNPTSSIVRSKGEAQERFQGVSSLISQWQTNASKGAPGWGTVGGKEKVSSSMERGEEEAAAAGEGILSKDRFRFEKKRMNSKDEDEIFRTSKADRSMIQGRLPSREV